MKEIGVFKGLLLYFGIDFVATIILVLLFGENVSNNLIMCVSEVLILFFIIKIGKVNREIIKYNKLDFKNKFDVKEIMGIVITQLALSIGIMMFLVSCCYIFLFGEVITEEVGSYYSNSVELILAIIAIVILIPIVEELIFRRIFFVRLAKKIGAIGSMIVTSIFFGILHEGLGIPGAIIFGIACCIIYMKYQNILIPISIHIINNAICMAVDVYDYFFTSTEVIEYVMTGSKIIGNLFIWGVILVVSLIVFTIFVIKNMKYITNNNEIFINSDNSIVDK